MDEASNSKALLTEDALGGRIFLSTAVEEAAIATGGALVTAVLLALDIAAGLAAPAADDILEATATEGADFADIADRLEIFSSL